jgi:hypothetical protein
MRLASRLGYGSLLGLSTFVVTSAAYTGCTGEVRQQTTPSADAGGCAAGEAARNFAGQELCCDGDDCHTVGKTSAQLGAPCSPGAADQPVDDITGTVDTCVAEHCNGDRVATDYLDTATETKGTLGCVASGSATTWQWTGPVSVHQVVLACVDTGVEACGVPGYGYGYGYYGDGCGCHTGPAGSPVCWDGSPCPGPTGYYGVNTVRQRAVTLVSSTCSVGGSAPSPCPQGSL